jgi:hypothetical protein
MGFIPHPPVVLSEIRVNDIWLLLAIGALWEFVCRMTLLLVKRKPQSLRTKELILQDLQSETEAMRCLGASTFVETSKLERQVLAKELELTKIYETRKK